jgi:carbon monoxide dehydrogenase subunit G
LTTTVRAHATIPAPPGEIFACLADYKQADVFIEGLEQLGPLSDKTEGEGTRFSAVLKIGPRQFATTIAISSFVPGRAITWSSAGERAQSLTFELETSPEGTSVGLTVVYEEPGGLAGTLAAPFVEQTVRHRADSALARLRAHLCHQ